jgi:predicted SprT family Zn-dependent metalloprotease
MKDFEKLKNECLEEIEEAGIRIGPIKSWSINTRARTRWGFCKRDRDGSYTIQIAAQLLSDDRVSEKACKETIIHELLHTCRGGMKHTGKWKEYAELMNRRYGYDIKRITTGTEKGLEEYTPTRSLPVKYVFVCGGCGTTIYRKRDSKFTRYYRQYLCTRCGAKAWRKLEVRKDG